VIDIDGRRADFLKEFLDEKAIALGVEERHPRGPHQPAAAAAAARAPAVGAGRPPRRPLRVGQLPVVNVESLTRGGLVG
jgi:hypothetical protein